MGKKPVTMLKRKGKRAMAKVDDQSQFDSEMAFYWIHYQKKNTQR